MASEMSEAKPANLSLTQMQEAILRIDRRIADLEAVDVSSILSGVDSIVGSHPTIEALQQKLTTFLVDTFGSDTIEYRRYVNALADLSPGYVDPFFGADPVMMARTTVARKIATALATLRGIKEGFEESLGDGRTTGKALRAYEGLELHPEIERAAGQLFRDEHYANAIEDAVKALNALVRLRSGVDDRDGIPLMEFVFSPKAPKLKFNALADDSDRDEQKGFMMMLGGAVAGLRNPRAHTIIKDDPERALEFIAYISLLAKLVDQAKK